MSFVNEQGLGHLNTCLRVSALKLQVRSSYIMSELKEHTDDNACYFQRLHSVQNSCTLCHCKEQGHVLCQINLDAVKSGRFQNFGEENRDVNKSPLMPDWMTVVELPSSGLDVSTTAVARACHYGGLRTRCFKVKLKFDCEHLKREEMCPLV